MNAEPNMKHRFSSDIIAASVAVIVAIAVANLCPTVGTDHGVTGISSARGQTAPIVLAQYNPCPNGKCRR